MPNNLQVLLPLTGLSPHHYIMTFLLCDEREANKKTSLTYNELSWNGNKLMLINVFLLSFLYKEVRNTNIEIYVSVPFLPTFWILDVKFDLLQYCGFCKISCSNFFNCNNKCVNVLHSMFIVLEHYKFIVTFTHELSTIWYFLL